jgi:hypothetical protein
MDNRSEAVPAMADAAAIPVTTVVPVLVILVVAKVVIQVQLYLVSIIQLC